jgi:hypothetical protein
MSERPFDGNEMRDAAGEGDHRDDEDQQEYTGEEGGDADAGTGGLHVDHGLADHRASAHPTEQAGQDVRRALAEGLTSLVGMGVGDVVDELGRHQ